MKINLLIITTIFIVLQYSIAELVVHWTFDNGTAQDTSVAGATLNGTLPGSTNNPTYLSTGGASGTGAFQFDGSNDYLIPSFQYDMGNGDWTVSFWMKTNDSANYPGYDGTLQNTVVGDVSGAIGFGLGVDAGKATFTHYYNGWHTVRGTSNVADNVGHYITFIHHDYNDTVDIYVDGKSEVLGAASYDGQYIYVIRDIGRSYEYKYATMILDDFRIYNHALTSLEVSQFTNVPEPNALFVILLAFFYVSLRKYSLF